ncbi:Di-copper centre-containing protein [Astrocystis sublimbata]|nr:Di-copper centre-containing protein [Astrocystis sublimbata]
MLGVTRSATFCLHLLLLAAGVYGDAVSDLWDKGKAALDAQLAKSSTCTKENMLVRREWGDLSADDRKAYIKAVLCITSSPSKLDPAQVPGAKTRYDDFVAVHINQTMFIHSTASFLSWHRYYTWAYEQVLRNECGYTGAQPYWDWGRWAADPEKSPIFDGSDTSMSGNGEKTTHQTFMVPNGNGGGCITSGPFKNMTVNLGPVSPAISPAPPTNPRRDGLGYNPRCLRRDVNNYLSSRYTRTQDIVNLINNSKTIAAFQNTMQAAGGTLGVHAAGHYTTAGDPAGDFYVSPGDPVFYLHHAMIDRTWTIWQAQDLQNRMKVVAGGRSMMGFGGAVGALTDEVNLHSVASKPYTIGDLVSITDGPFCYTYA